MQTIHWFFAWLNTNQGAVQALSSVATAGITLVLVIITNIYVRANLRSTKTIEADLRFRTLPLPKISFEPSLNVSSKEKNYYSFHLTISTENAPLRIEVLDVRFRDDETIKKVQLVDHVGQIVSVGERAECSGKAESHSLATGWSVHIGFADVASLSYYRGVWDQHADHVSVFKLLDEDLLDGTIDGKLRRVLAKLYARLIKTFTGFWRHK